MKILVIGGDGFCGWPTSLHLSDLGHDVIIVDNLARRKIDIELGVNSLTPIRSMENRILKWEELGKNPLRFVNLDIFLNVEGLRSLIYQEKPDVIVHFGEQRAAPYSMKNYLTKAYTVQNNLGGTINLLTAIVDIDPNIHLVHLGTMGVYGYNGSGFALPEGYINATLHFQKGDVLDTITYPPNPGSIYHVTKVMDAQLFKFFAQNNALSITDLHQGIVWGTQTPNTRLHEDLVNRFDYDGDYGTVLNRFLVQAAIGYPLTVHGSGEQTRAFINIQDTCRCIQLAIENPPTNTEQTQIRNQISETQSVIGLAQIINELTGVEINNMPNPRKEAASNTLLVSNESFKELGFDPITIKRDLVTEIKESVQPYIDRIDTRKIVASSLW